MDVLVFIEIKMGRLILGADFPFEAGAHLEIIDES